MPSIDTELSPVSDGHVIIESDLPLPVVYYPPLFGTFLGFAPDRRSTPALCACAKPALANLLRLRPILRARRVVHEARRSYFPLILAGKFTAWKDRSGFPLVFQPGLCHRCNAHKPTLRYCDASQGTPFVQSYGWYINQAYLRLGVLPYRHAYLSEVCPPDYRAEIETSRRLELEFLAECNRILDSTYDFAIAAPHNGDWLSRFRSASEDDFGRLVELREQASRAREHLKTKFEDLVRQDLGLMVH